MSQNMRLRALLYLFTWEPRLCLVQPSDTAPWLQCGCRRETEQYRKNKDANAKKPTITARANTRADQEDAGRKRGGGWRKRRKPNAAVLVEPGRAVAGAAAGSQGGELRAGLPWYAFARWLVLAGLRRVMGGWCLGPRISEAGRPACQAFNAMRGSLPPALAIRHSNGLHPTTDCFIQGFQIFCSEFCPGNPNHPSSFLFLWIQIVDGTSDRTFVGTLRHFVDVLCTTVLTAPTLSRKQESSPLAIGPWNTTRVMPEPFLEER